MPSATRILGLIPQQPPDGETGFLRTVQGGLHKRDVHANRRGGGEELSIVKTGAVLPPQTRALLHRLLHALLVQRQLAALPLLPSSSAAWLTSPVNMTSENTSGSRIELYDSALTVPSDSENYSANHELSSSPPSTSSSPLILYKPPSLWSILRGAAINLILPFVNGLMLGLGELLAHEAAFRLGWSNTKVGLSLTLFD